MNPSESLPHKRERRKQARPGELLDAARLDGASEFRIWWQIVMPQVRTPLIIVDPTAETMFVVRRPALEALATGATPPRHLRHQPQPA